MGKIIFVFEIIGVCAFSISGAVMCITKKLDLFGVVFCGLITALGGGVLRDVLLGLHPPVMFLNYIYCIFAIVSAVTTFFMAKIFKTKFNIIYINRFNNIFDALGLGVFTIVGINTAIFQGYVHNPYFVIFLGMTTGCGGSILRDIIIREVPMIFSKQIYAVASILGGIVYYLMYIIMDLNEVVSVVCGITSVFVIRILASIYKWNLPKAI